MRVDAIIQARVGSTRLPGKVLLRILDKTILEYVIERVSKAKTIRNVVVATSVEKRDLRIINLVSKLGASIYSGAEEDVLDRFYQAARLYKMQHIVRITADSPLIDPDIIDKNVKHYFNSNADYCSNIMERTFPDGVDVEVFNFDVLRNAWKNAKLSSEREHVTPYIWKNPDKFRLASFKNETNLGDKRWTLDTKEDFEFIKIILESLSPANLDFHMEDVLNFLQSNPHLEQINKGPTPDEGYLKSLREDKIINISDFE